jgi:hypothetical protein
MKELYKTLVLGWSIVWAACLITLAQVKIPQLGGIATILAFNQPKILFKLLYLVPLYAFGLWVAGCLLLGGVCWLLGRWIK